MEREMFARGLSRVPGVGIRFDLSQPELAQLDVGGSTPRLTVDTSKVRQLIPQETLLGKPAVQIVSDDVPGELAVADCDIAFSPLRDLYSEVADGLSFMDEGLPALIGWHDAYRYLDRLTEVAAVGDEDAIFATVLRCLAYRWGALQAGIAIWESDLDFRLNAYDEDLIQDFGQESGETALPDSGASLRDGKWEGTNLDLRLINFRGADLSGCRLHGDFSGSDFGGAHLQDSMLIGCDFSYCNFEGADLRGADLTKSAVTGARFSDPSAIRTDMNDGVVMFLGWSSSLSTHEPDGEPASTTATPANPSEPGPGLNSRIQTPALSARYGSQPGNWAVSFDPATSMFTVRRTNEVRKPRGAESFSESGNLEVQGWQKRVEEGQDRRETYVEEIRFSLESLCSDGDVRWVSDDVLLGWQKIVASARNRDRIETRLTADTALFDYSDAQSLRQMPIVEASNSSTPSRHHDEPTWPVEAATAFAELHHLFSSLAVDIPMVPLHLMKRLRRESRGMWSTGPELDPGQLYLLQFDAEQFAALLSPSIGDFWFSGMVRGKFCLAARIGPILLLQQHYYSNDYGALSGQELQEFRNGVRAWNTSIGTFKELPGSDYTIPKMLIAYSDFRFIAVVREIHSGVAAHGRVRNQLDVIPGRTIYTLGDRGAVDPVLTALQGSRDPIISAAAKHVGLLTEGVANARRDPD